jgi:hypothetical protein
MLPHLLPLIMGAAILLLFALGTIGTPIWSFGTGDLIKESSLGNETAWQMQVLPNGTARGIAFPKITTGNFTALGYVGIFTIAPSFTMTTGITIYVNSTDDGTIAADLGNTWVLGVTAMKVTAHNTTFGGGTEVTSTVTNSGTSGVLVQTAVALANASLNGAGAGDTIALRFRRVGSSTSDLVLGRVLITPSILVTDT